ncbi:MAG: ShlB/FhaC/HecB family hemolysin secretion/activation protein [Pseudomonadota bacterium]
MKIHKARHLLSIIGCGAAAITASSALAQQVLDPQAADEARKSAQPAKQPDAPLIKVEPARSAAAPAADGATVVVSQFKFSGNTAYPAEALAPLVASYLGKPVTMADLGEAADRIKGYYRSQGWFLAQAYIPKQASSGGVIEIAVLEGRLDQVTVNVAPDAPISAARAKQLVAAHIGGGHAITEYGIERPLLLLRDIPRVDAKSVIDPGGAPGTANIVVNVVRDPDAPVVSGRVELDNFGSRFSGSARLGAEVNINNPYGLGDHLSLRGFLANESGNRFGRIGYSLPLGAHGTRGGISAARLGYLMGKDFANLKLNGIAEVLSGNVVHPFIRSKHNNVFGQISAQKQKLTDRNDVQATSEEHTVDSVSAQINGDLRDRFAGLTIYRLNLTRGKLEIHDPFRMSFDQSAFGAHSAGSFTKYTLSMQRLQQLVAGVHAVFTLSAQGANKNLHPAEKFALGGESTVRAFPVGKLIGDKGYSASAELRWGPPGLKVGPLEVVPIVFYDLGQVTRNHDNSRLKERINSQQLSGYGVGMNTAYGEKVMFKVSVAWQGKQYLTFPSSASSPVEEAKDGARVWASLSYSF